MADSNKILMILIGSQLLYNITASNGRSRLITSTL